MIFVTKTDTARAVLIGFMVVVAEPGPAPPNAGREGGEKENPDIDIPGYNSLINEQKNHSFLASIILPTAL